jgi:hypothetical protein
VCATNIGQFGLGDDGDKDCSQTPQSDTHDSPSSYLSAADIPLSNNIMQRDPKTHSCLDTIEGELSAQQLSLKNICDQLGQLLL